MGEEQQSSELYINKEIGERLEHPENVCLASTTFMRSWKREGGDLNNPEQVRGDLAIESIKIALSRGFRVVIVDGGSSDDFINKLGEISAEVKSKNTDKKIKVHDLIVETETDRGYSGSRRQALRRAENLREEGVKAILMMEIEKTSITQNAEILVRPILEGNADLVVPERGIRVNLNKKDPHAIEKNEDFRGYPPYQAYSEMWSNKMLDRLLVSARLKSKDEAVLDLFGGTRVIKNDPDVLEDFYQKHIVYAGEGKTNPKMYFDAAYAPIAYLLAKNRRVVSVPIEYQHPAEQTATEINASNFDEKRDNQRNMITAEMARQTRFLGELKRFLAIETNRFPYEYKAFGFGVEGKSNMINGAEIVFHPEEPMINASFELLKLARTENKSKDELIDLEGRTILEALLDQKFRLCDLSGKEIDQDMVIDEKTGDFVGSENSKFIIRKSMVDENVREAGLEVCSWGRFFYNDEKWIIAVDEGSELDAAILVANDILEDYQIKMSIMVIPYRDFKINVGGDRSPDRVLGG